jgi:hypothetical protein
MYDIFENPTGVDLSDKRVFPTEILGKLKEEFSSHVNQS